MREGRVRKYEGLEDKVEPWANIELVKKMFPAKYLPHMSFEDVGDNIRISLLKYLGKEDFAKIASIVRDASGEYVPAGKNSHFNIPKVK